MKIKTLKLSILLLFATISAYAQNTFIPFNSRQIDYQGRIAFKKDAAELIWSGTSIKLNFKGTSLSGKFKDADTSNYYNVIIDRDSIYQIRFDTVAQTYMLADNLPYGNHTIELFKRTEWDKGKTWFYGFETNTPFKVLKPTKKPKRKIEFYGNSITCGYAIEDMKTDSPAGYFENNYNTYAAITARHFNAQYHCISKSGIGIMVSWFPMIMPEMYNRIDPNDNASKWDFSNYQADVVVINLFQNDSWIINNHNYPEFKHRFGTQAPNEAFIINAYSNFVKPIREHYPKAQIICMLGNMDITRKGSPWPGYVEKAVASLKDPKIFTFFMPFKESSGHPKTAEQKAMADKLIEFIDKNIKW
jgi:hypothetical protein